MPVSSWVDSVEFINATISGSNNSASYNLTKGQDYTHCIPFYTVCGNSTYFDNRLTDVYFSGTTQSGVINFARSNNRSTSNYIKCYVVEFNPSQVRVQQGAFSLNGLTTTDVTIPTTVSGTDRVAMTFGWQTNNTSQFVTAIVVRGSVTNTTTLNFYRYAATSNCTGHWFLFEDLGNNFRVNHILTSHATTGQTVQIYGQTAVDPLRTFILGSYACNGTDVGLANYWSIRIFLYSRGTVRTDRQVGTAYTIYWAAQVVKILDQTKVYVPMDHALVSWTTPDAFSRNVAGVSGRVPLVCNPQTSTISTAMAQGLARGNDGVTAGMNSWIVASEITASGTITHTKFGTSYAAYPSYTVAVDWAGIAVDTGTNPNPIPEGNGHGQSFVKSVENFRFTLTGNLGAYVLTKGQVASNCAAFSSNRTDGSDTSNTGVVNVYIGEPGIVYIQHWDDVQTSIIDVSIVEFHPNQVKVQQKNIAVDVSSTTLNIGIDEISSIDKAFIICSSFTTNTGGVNAFRYSFYRLSFTSTTNVEMYKYTAGSETVCTFFVVEDLQNNFITKQFIHTMFAGYNQSIYDDGDWGFHNTFPVVSYTTNEAENYASTGSIKSVYISPHRPIYCAKGHSSAYNIYCTSMIVKFLDEKRHTQPINTSSNTSAVITGTYNEELRGTENITAYSVCQYSTLECSSTTTAAYSDTLGTIRITNYNTGEYELSKGAGVYSSSFGMHLINWIGYDYKAANNITGTRTKSFINSIQRDSFSTSNGWLKVWLRYNQDITKCVPFIGSSAVASDYYCPRVYKSVHRYSDQDCFGILFGSNSTSSRTVVSYIVEFNQEIKIQPGSGYTTGTSKVFTIEEVNLDRAFLHFFSYSDAFTKLNRHHAVCGRFTSSTEITFDRDLASAALYISWYVVECPDWGADSYWTVYRSYSTALGSAATLYAWLSTQPAVDRTIFLSSYSDAENEGIPAFGPWRIYNRQDHGVQMDKSGVSYSMTAFNIEAIEFSASLASKGFKVYSNFYTLSAGTTTTSVDLKLNSYDNFHIQNSIITLAHGQNLTRSDSTSSIGPHEGSHCLEFDDTTGSGYSRSITISRGTSAYVSYGYYYAIQFPEYNKYYFSGYVTETGSPVVRKVVAYKSSSGELMDTTTSISGTGYFYLETTSYEPHYIVALDDDDGMSYNDLIYGKIYPTAISGAFAWVADYPIASGIGEPTMI
jgi:hypothetical protein